MKVIKYRNGKEVLRLGTQPGRAHSDGDTLGDDDEVLIFGTDPLLTGTSVVDIFGFGNNGDFGTAIDSTGFYSGTPGVAGTDDSGFDPDGKISDMVGGWHRGSYSNYGFRIAFSVTSVFP